MRWPRPRASGPDAGSAAIVVVIFTLTVLTLAAFIIDGGLAIASRERAADIAEQAARYAAQDLDEEALRQGAEAPPIDIAACQGNVREFVAEIRLTSAEVLASQVRCEGSGNEVTVTVPVSYDPIFGRFFSGGVTVYGTATAEARTG